MKMEDASLLAMVALSSVEDPRPTVHETGENIEEQGETHEQSMSAYNMSAQFSAHQAVGGWTRARKPGQHDGERDRKDSEPQFPRTSIAT